MKRYNLSEIMTSAHRTYKYVGKKQGKTFGEVLKSTWMLAKLSAEMDESIEKTRQASIKKASDCSKYQFIVQLIRPHVGGYVCT